jgi:hypothetical protein
MKSFDSKKSNYMQGLKIAILAIFQTGPGCPCPNWIPKIIFALGFYKFLSVDTEYSSISRDILLCSVPMLEGKTIERAYSFRVQSGKIPLLEIP